MDKRAGKDMNQSQKLSKHSQTFLLSGTARIFRANLVLVVNLQIPLTAGMLVNVTLLAVESRTTAVTATNSWENKLLIVKLMARGLQKSFQHVSVSTNSPLNITKINYSFLFFIFR